jgi:hypothetical protein
VTQNINVQKLSAAIAIKGKENGNPEILKNLLASEYN